MRTITANINTTIGLGIQGENNTTTIIFPLVKEFREKYGDGSFTLINQRPFDTNPYPVVTTTDSDNVRWVVNQSDTEFEGFGECQLHYYVGDALAKTLIFTTHIKRALVEPGEVPEPYEDWVDTVVKAKEAIENMTADAELKEDVGDTRVVVTKSEQLGHSNLKFDFYNISSGGGSRTNFYGEINNYPTTSTKTVTVDNSFQLVNGIMITVLWKQASGGSTFDPIYLNVNGTGAKRIRYGASSVDDFIPMQANSVWVLVYNSVADCWTQTGFCLADNIRYGFVRLSDSITDGTSDYSQSKAATPKAVYLVHQEALSLENRLDSEISNRAEADNDIQSQIDALVSKSDVVDVVGTYAELLAYDTSTLGNNDVVKVLSDSTHDNTRSYYRWIIEESSGSWHYVGSESVGYTKAETDAALADKEPLSFHVEVESFDLEEGTVTFNKTFGEIYEASTEENRYVYLDIPQINHTIFDVTSITSTFIAWIDVIIFNNQPTLVLIQIFSNDSGSVSMTPLAELSDIPDIPDVPTKVSDLTNDLGFQTETQVANLILDTIPTIRKMVVQEDAGGYYVEVTTE